MNTKEMFEVLDRVKTWMPEMQLVLAQKILEMINSQNILQPPRSMSADQVFGILETDKPAPTDEECKQIINEERMKKYG